MKFQSLINFASGFNQIVFGHENSLSALSDLKI